MSNHRLYLPCALSAGNSITIEGQPAHHLLVVLRMRRGTDIRVFDGQGHEHHAVLADTGRGQAILEIGAAITSNLESSLQITLAQGITRHDRMDMILQKAVELGVCTIQPLWLQRSQTRLKGERLNNRLRHWQGILINACEQCGRNTLPHLSPPTNLPLWLDKLPLAGLKLQLHPAGSTTLGSLARPPGGVMLLVGPEGGMNEDELSLGRTAGFAGIRLGPRILRTETAGLAAISGMQTLWGDFS
jgi:16S rRNA (uracil1498-N3)-methyltransferase